MPSERHAFKDRILRNVIFGAVLSIAICLWWLDGSSSLQIEGSSPNLESTNFLASRRRNRLQSETVLSASALNAFENELPHWWYGAIDNLLRHLPRLPDLAGALHLSGLRKEFERYDSDVVLVEDSDPHSPYYKWRNIVHELCHMLGFPLESDVAAAEERELQAMTALRSLDIGVGGRLASLGGADSLPMCPEIWVDEGWPPSPLAPSGSGKRSPPVWSAAGAHSADRTGRHKRKERGLVVLHAPSLETFPEAEAKALIGYELGIMMWEKLPTALPPEWLDNLAKLFMVARIYIQFREAIAPPAQPTWFGSSMGDQRRQRQHARSLAGRLGLGGRADSSGLGSSGDLSILGALGKLFQGPAAPATEWMALNMVMSRAVPWMFRPLVYGGMLAKGGPQTLLSPVQQTLKLFSSTPAKARAARSFPILPASIAPLAGLVGEAGALQGLRSAAAVHSRSAAITADRVAALAAGDADTAAMAILRAQGLIKDAWKDRQTEMMHYIARSAENNVWKKRLDATLLGSATPSAEVRVRELLHWATTYGAYRLIAFAELRRGTFRPVYSSPWQWLFAARGYFSATNWFFIGRVLLLGMLTLPFVFSVDLIRWSTVSTLTLTFSGIIAPFLFDDLLDAPMSFVLPSLMLVYAGCIWSLWWNHLFGGARQWAQLSSRLTSQLAEQADVTAGIACLTKDWAEMAHRSLAALDEELCGSWRSSLSELASKFMDLQQECEQGDSGDLAVQEPRAVERQRRKSSKSGTSLGAKQDDGDRDVLWLKVDRLVQRGLCVEVDRMKGALAATKPQELQDMMTWWAQSETSSSSTAVVTTVGRSRQSSPYSLLSNAFRPSPRSGGQLTAGGETLGALLLAETLHQRYPYPGSFIANGRSSEEVEEKSHFAEALGAAEFVKLQSALTSNQDSMKMLQGRLIPLTKDILSSRCCRLSDLVYSLGALCMVVLGSFGFGKQLDYDSQGSREERAGARRYVLSFALAMVAAIATCIVAMRASMWCSASAAAGFAMANAFLLLNNRSLSLPHVHRRLERQLDDLSDRREHILQEIRTLHLSSQQDSLAHAKACVIMQSVNFLRNVNYIMLCVKTESRRAASMVLDHTVRPSQAQHRVVQRGLQLLFALLPRSDPSWQEEILLDADCGKAAALLRWRPDVKTLPCLASSREATASATSAECASMQHMVADAQKRLSILFRMVHLSCALPVEAQGRVSSLLESYVRPVLCEGRVPTRASILEVGDKRQPSTALMPRSSSAGFKQVSSSGNVTPRAISSGNATPIVRKRSTSNGAAPHRFPVASRDISLTSPVMVSREISSDSHSTQFPSVAYTWTRTTSQPQPTTSGPLILQHGSAVVRSQSPWQSPVLSSRTLPAAQGARNSVGAVRQSSTNDSLLRSQSGFRTSQIETRAPSGPDMLGFEAVRFVRSKKEIALVLAALPRDVLVKPTAQYDQFLQDLFSSVIISIRRADAASAAVAAAAAAVSTSGQAPEPGDYRKKFREAFTAITNHGGNAGLVRDRQPVVAVGCRLGDREYSFNGLRTKLMIRVVVVDAAKLLAEESIDVRLARGQQPHRLEETEVLLSAMMDEAPENGLAVALWRALHEAAPDRFGEAELRRRRAALQRVPRVDDGSQR